MQVFVESSKAKHRCNACRVASGCFALGLGGGGGGWQLRRVVAGPSICGVAFSSAYRPQAQHASSTEEQSQEMQRLQEEAAQVGTLVGWWAEM